MRKLLTTACAGVMAVVVGMVFPVQAEARATKADVLTDPGEVKVGHAKLKRTASGIMFDLHTTMLGPDVAYTIWWIVFNNPEACVGGCGGDDLGNADVEGSVLFATGRVANAWGEGWFTAFLPKGFVRLNRTETGRERHRLGPGLQNVKGAEIHLVIRGHGPALSGAALVEQLATFNGGCINPPGGGDVENDNCIDVQFAVFPVPNSNDDDDDDDD